MKLILEKVLISLGILVFCGLGHAQARVYIDVTSQGIRKLNVAIPDFIRLLGPNGPYRALNGQIQDVLAFDFQISGYLNVQKKDTYIEKTSDLASLEDFNLEDWRLIGTELLVRGGLRLTPNLLEAEVRLVDVLEGKTILSKVYRGDHAQTRRIAHTMASDILEKLTGERGVFDSQIVFSRKTTSRAKEVYMMDIDGANPIALTKNGSLNLFPAVSPDGTRIAFTSYRHDNPDLYMLNLSKGTLARILAHPGLNTTPAFFPDGRRLVVTLTKDGNAELYEIDSSGKILRRLTRSPGEDISPSVSPDGRRVVFVSDRAGGLGLYELDLESLTTRRLVPDMGYCTDPSYSPTGDRIVFAARQEGSFDLYSLQVDGAGLLRHTFGEGRNEHPAVSLDGRLVAFDSTRSGVRQIYLLNLKTGDVVRVSRSKYEESQPAWRKR